MTKTAPLTVVLALTILSPAAALPSSAAASGQDVAVSVKEVEPFPYVAVLHKGPYADMATVVGQLISAMQAQGLFAQIRGPMVGVYHNSPADTPPEELFWEVGYVVTAQTVPQLPLVKKVWEHTTAAAALHIGPYEKLGETLAKIMAWIAANGWEVAGPVLERYLDMNPMAVKPEDRRTEVLIPCRRK